MSRYLSILIKNDFHGLEDIEKAKQYAENSIPLFKKFYNSQEMEFGIEFDTLVNGITEIWIEHYYQDDDKICSILLRDGYWAFETYYDDYFFPQKSDKGSYKIRDLCKSLCKALNQDEAWVCVHDHLTNSCTAPDNFCDWLDYAQQFGVVELTDEMMDGFGPGNYGFIEEKYRINGEDMWLTTPIYHDSFLD